MDTMPCSKLPPFAIVTSALEMGAGTPTAVNARVAIVGRGFLTRFVTVVLSPRLLSRFASAAFTSWFRSARPEPILLIIELPELYWGSVRKHITEPPLL
jgi:hypothetical protein